MSQTLIDLIRSDAADATDKSGKSELDAWIESHVADGELASAELAPIVKELHDHNWKEWRALRQIVRRLKIRSTSLSNELALLTEHSRPLDPRARFYAYLTRMDLGTSAAMDELLQDTGLQSSRPSDWLALAYNEATPSALHSYYMQNAGKLRADDFVLSLDKLRAKYADKFVDNLMGLCLAMPFTEADELAKTIDEDYQCGLHDVIISTHPALHRHSTDEEFDSHKVVRIFETLNDDMKHRLGQR